MDNNQPVQQPVVNNTVNVTPTGHEKKVGPIVATLIIVLVLIIAALYVFASKINTPADTTDAAAAADQTTLTVVKPTTNTSTDVKDLQNDLNSATDGLNTQAI